MAHITELLPADFFETDEDILESVYVADGGELLTEHGTNELIENYGAFKERGTAYVGDAMLLELFAITYDADKVNCVVLKRSVLADFETDFTVVLDRPTESVTHIAFSNMEQARVMFLECIKMETPDTGWEA